MDELPRLIDLYRQFKEDGKCGDTAAALLVLATVIQSKEILDPAPAEQLIGSISAGAHIAAPRCSLRVGVDGPLATPPCLFRDRAACSRVARRVGPPPARVAR